jgi:uncharacterized protein (TIGR03435 family)
MKNVITRTSCGAFLLLGLAYGQTEDKQPKFDAASVKAVNPRLSNGRIVVGMTAPTGGPGTNDPSRILYPVISLRFLLTNAYDVRADQIVGPGWLDTQFFVVEATMPPDTTKERFRAMLQNLLSDRFKLQIRRETRETREQRTYSLVVTGNGLKMKESKETAPQPVEDPRPDRQPQKLGEDGFPVSSNVPAGRAGMSSVIGTHGLRLIGQQQTMHDLADNLSTLLRRPVSDATALTAKYDFTLTFSLPTPSGLDTQLPDIFSAVQSQLGLKLVESRQKVPMDPMEMIVIDHIEKTPTEN